MNALFSVQSGQDLGNNEGILQLSSVPLRSTCRSCDDLCMLVLEVFFQLPLRDNDVPKPIVAMIVYGVTCIN